VERKGKERRNRLGERGQAGRKRKVVEEREGERRGRRRVQCCPVSENSLKIHWLQMHQNPFSAGATPRTPLREDATLLQLPRRLGRFPSPYPSSLEAFGVSISSPHQRRLGS